MLKKFEHSRTLTIVLKALATVVALNLVLIAAALVVGITRMIHTVISEGISKNLALPELLLVVLVISLLTAQYNIFKQYKKEKTITVEEEFFVVAPAGGHQNFFPQLVNAN